MNFLKTIGINFDLSRERPSQHQKHKSPASQEELVTGISKIQDIQDTSNTFRNKIDKLPKPYTTRSNNNSKKKNAQGNYQT